MSIQPGTRLGTYEIEALIGAGGMGEVYRARDTRLGRSVAIKSLPASFATDPQRVARFQREAQLLAALNHQNIAAIYGLEEAPSTLREPQGRPESGRETTSSGQAPAQFLVLELVEGETLADRLKAQSSGPKAQGLTRGRPAFAKATAVRGSFSGGGESTLEAEGQRSQRAGEVAWGPARLEIDEVLRIARQIADALEAAHEKGIIHRDLKPANIALTAEGQVKVLDFGLAKALEPDLANAVPGDLTHSPTLTFAATQAGMVLGTAAYMSPEQAKGKVADKRSDVWAFGCVLFEMLTGARAFEGDDASDTLAAVLRGEPNWSALPADTPPGITKLLRRCLAKDPRERLRDIGDVRFELKDAEASSVGAAARTAAVVHDVASPVRGGARALLPWGVAAVLAAALAATVVVWAPWGARDEPRVLRLHTEVGANVSLAVTQAAGATLSADGQTLAFAAGRAGASPQLYVRRLDRLEATALAGTEDAFGPFFSPDGQWVAFFAGGKLKKISVTGGSAITLCDAPNGRGGSWGDDDAIVFQPNNLPGSGLSRVSAAGGAPAPLTTPNEKELHRWPHVLPGARAVLYSSTDAATFADGNIVVQPLPEGPAKVVHRGGYFGRYATSGYLVYLHDGTLFAVPFDPDRLEATGQAVPALEGVQSNPLSGGAQLALANSGTFVYVPGQSIDSAAPMHWMDRSGKPTPLRERPANWSNPHFAPDGRRLAIDIFDGAQVDVWVYEWARDTLSRLTFDAADDQRPVWTPDGRRIAFSSKRGDKAVSNLYWQRADGTGEMQRLTESANTQVPGTWHPSGKFFAFSEQVPKFASDLMILPIEGDEATGWKPGKPTVFLSGPFNESSPMFSPDGRWIAYISNESGRNDIYVRPFPGPGGKWQVSTGQADDPTWSRTQRELFYAAIPDQRLMVAPYTVEGDSFRIEKPQVWSEGRFNGRPRAPSRDLDLHPDGLRFALAAGGSTEAPVELNNVVFIFNFGDGLRQLHAPTRE